MDKLVFTALNASITEALENVFNSYVKPEMMGIANIGLYIIAAVLLIALIYRGLFVWKTYNQAEGEVKWGALLVLFICLIVAISAKVWMWSIIGW